MLTYCGLNSELTTKLFFQHVKLDYISQLPLKLGLTM